VVLGGSAGAIEALTRIITAFPADLDAAVLVALHMNPSAPSLLPAILGRKTRLRTLAAEDNMQLESGVLYVCQPDRHLTLHGDRIRLGRGPRENGFRPAVDPLFRSAAASHGAAVIGAVISGNLDDGTGGLLEIKRRGGIAVVQDPDDAMYSGMPASALQEVPNVDYVLHADAIGETITSIITEARTASIRIAKDIRPDVSIGGGHPLASDDEREQGVPANLGCPDCGGTLWQTVDGELVRYRCRVGHAYSDEALLEAQTETLETALWTAVRALEETKEQARNIFRRMERRGHPQLAERFRRQAEDAERRAAIVRDALNFAAGNPHVQAM
jgi:two-component system, chemotaxis family, protein-glutamate methylesterase/glutaminase